MPDKVIMIYNNYKGIAYFILFFGACISGHGCLLKPLPLLAQLCSFIFVITITTRV